jgi:C4-dicarboxylate-specific signal transduction histidine kinase
MATLLDVCRKIDEQARRAGDVLANLRRFIRKQEVEAQVLDINGVIADVVNLIEADATAEGIPLEIRYADNLPRVRGGAVQIQQVVLNLTRNSVDAMRDGAHKDRGIAIATAATAGGGVRITVADHGYGVPHELGDNIFNPFVTTKREGLGVGLAISRTIVQAYGGSLTYTDNPEGGSIFAVELPPLTEEEA